MEQSEKHPVENKGLQKETQKTNFDEFIEGVEKISADDFVKNPQTAIHLLILLLKEKAIHNRVLSTKVESQVIENKDLSNKLSVANERLNAKENFSWIINFITALGGVLLTLGSTGEFKIANLVLNKLLIGLGLLLTLSGLMAFFIDRIRNMSGSVKEVKSS